MPAFRTGDLDLSFAFRDADGDAALFAAVEFMRIPLFPAHFYLSRQLPDVFCLLQKPEPFIGTLVMVPGK